MRVRLIEEAQYSVNMCWLCMPIRKDATIWNTQDFPAEHKEMKTKDDLEKPIHVVSQTDGKYQINGVKACAASGHTCMAFNSTLEAFRNQKDWLTYARRDPEFDEGLPNETCQSEKLHSAKAQRLFMDHTLNLFPPLVSPMAYPKGKMSAHIREWYASHWGRELGEKELFEEGVKLMR